MLRSKSIIKIYQSSGGYKDPLPGNLQNYQCLLFTDFNSITVDSSWDNLASTAKFIIPRKVRKVIGTLIGQPTTTNGTISDNPLAQIINQSIKENIPEAFIINDLTLPTYRFVTYDPTVGTYSVSNGGIPDSQFTKSYKPDKNGKQEPYYRTNPLIQVGDIVTIQLGYIIGTNPDEIDTTGSYNVNYLSGNLNNNGIQTLIQGGNNPDKDNKNFYINYIDDLSRIQNSGDITDNRDLIFYGYISKVSISIDGNVTVDCEDYMWYLKKARVPNKIYHTKDAAAGAFYQQLNANNSALNIPQNANTNYTCFSNPGGYSINSMLADMVLSPISFSTNNNQLQQGNTVSGIQNIISLPLPLFVNDSTNQTINGLPLANPVLDIYANIDTIIGDVELSNNATVYNFLKKIKDDYEIPSFFNIQFTGTGSNVQMVPFLYCSTYVYEDRLSQRLSEFNQFIFGTNIIESNLEWKDNSTLNAGAIIKSHYLEGTENVETGTVQTTKTGKPKKKAAPIPVQCGDPTGPQFSFWYTTSNLSIIKGDKATIKKSMVEWGLKQLQKVTYTGFYGIFTKFLYPYVKWGDVIYISDPLIPERNGFYYVKKVVTKANFSDGLIQEVTIDYKTIVSDPNNIIKH